MLISNSTISFLGIKQQYALVAAGTCELCLVVTADVIIAVIVAVLVSEDAVLWFYLAAEVPASLFVTVAEILRSLLLIQN